jgi:hypothetical protein
MRAHLLHEAGRRCGRTPVIADVSSSRFYLAPSRVLDEVKKGTFDKLARPERETSNALLSALAEWNTYLVGQGIGNTELHDGRIG